jgi:anti-sigma B factor antagonist
MFRCWVEDRPFAAVVHVQGDVDLLTAAEFRRCVHTTANGRTGNGCVAVDLSGLEYLDATGFLTLEEGRQLCRLHDRELVLVAPPRHVERILALLRLTDSLPVLTSVEALAERAPAHSDHAGSRRRAGGTAPPADGERCEESGHSRGR